jgi:peptidoglycan/xylan/chitin deacetylase (PgdA/CDA1 family)
MKIAWSAVVRQVLLATGQGKLTILIYHRVHGEPDMLFPAAADARRFDEQMAWIAAALDVVPLPEAIEMLRNGRLPSRAACITFDDGYADNVEVALPILQRRRLHATFFVTTGFLDGGRMWNDTIIESIRRAPGQMLDLEAMELGSMSIGSPQERRKAIDRIIGRMKYLSPDVRLAQVDALAHRVGASLPRDLMMRSDQVRALHAAGMEIGAHTATHPILARLDDGAALAEIRDGRAALESIIGAPVALFAYPNGKPGSDYAPAHVAMVRELGFAAALSTQPGTATARSDFHELPRFTPWGNSFLRVSADLARNHLAN